MKQLFMIGTVLLCLFISCQDDDSTTTAPAGSYSMVRVTGGLVGVNRQFSRSEIIWQINSAQDSVVITNNVNQNGIPSGYETGRYAYAVRNSGGDNELCTKSLYISNNYFGCYSSSNDTIIIDDAYADGFRYTLVKN